MKRFWKDGELREHPCGLYVLHEDVQAEIESLRQQLAECQSELADQKRLCVDDEMVVDLPAGFKHRIKFQCDMLPLTDAELDDYAKSPFGIKNWIRKQLDRISECEREIERQRDAYAQYVRGLTDKLATLTAERDELAVDAKRYRWLRAYCEMIEYAEPAVQEDQDNLDAAIDAAIAKLGADKTGEV